MKNLFKLLFCTMLLIGGSTVMANSIEQPFNQGEINPYNKYFTGTTYLEMLSKNDDVWNSSET